MRTMMLMMGALLAGCATMPASDRQEPRRGSRAELDALLAGREAGPPQRCVLRNRVRSTDTFEGALVYRESGRRIYVNVPRGACTGPGRDDILVTMQPIGSYYCEGDIIRTVDRLTRVPTGSCTLGEFIPYTRR